MEFYQELSKLEYSTDCYISGMLALNITDYENNTGDWHRGTFWNENSKISSSHIMGKNSPVCKIDTSKYFGKVGIFKANDALRRMGVPEFSSNIISANHARSIADLVVYFSLQNNNPCSVIDFYSFDDFMELPSDKEKVFYLLDMAIKNLSDDNAKKIVVEWLNKAKDFDYE